MRIEWCIVHNYCCTGSCGFGPEYAHDHWPPCLFSHATFPHRTPRCLHVVKPARYLEMRHEMLYPAVPTTPLCHAHPPRGIAQSACFCVILGVFRVHLGRYSRWLAWYGWDPLYWVRWVNTRTLFCMCIPCCPASCHVATVPKPHEIGTLVHFWWQKSTVHVPNIAASGSNLFEGMRVVQRVTRHLNWAKAFGPNPAGGTYFFYFFTFLFFDLKKWANNFLNVIFVLSGVTLTRAHLETTKKWVHTLTMRARRKLMHFESVCGNEFK